MNKNNSLNKGIAFGIIVLFVGASIVPSISGNLRGFLSVENVKSYENEKVQSETSTENSTSVPLFFTKNEGQFPKDVRFQTHVSGVTVYLCQNRIVSVFNQPAVEEPIVKSGDLDFRSSIEWEIEKCKPRQVKSIVAKFIDANMDAAIIGKGLLPHYNNYFIGNNPDKWYTDVPNYEAVMYNNIYPGIDLRYYSYGGSMKYDFIVYPGADLSLINICYEGVENLKVTPMGDLEVKTSFGSLLEKAPLMYQNINGVQHEVEGRYELRDKGVFGFTLDESFNPLYPIVIDPELAYSTFLGGTGSDQGDCIAVDSDGNTYVTGVFWSPITLNPCNDSLSDSFDVFVAKFSPSTRGVNSLIYITYLGGNNTDHGSDIAIDSDGNAYITGHTFSPDFPTTPNAYDDSYNGVKGLEYTDIFVSKLSTSGDHLVYSTYLGGTHNDEGWSIAVDSDGNAYITGGTKSPDFPTTPNAYDNSYNGGNLFGGDVFVAELSPSTGGPDSLIYSTFLGGEVRDTGNGIAIDSDDNVYITGGTQSPNFPTTPDAYDNSYNGGGILLSGGDVFVAKLSLSTGGPDSLIYSTFLGGEENDHECYIAAIDSDGNVYIAGCTASFDFPTTPNAYDNTYNGGDPFWGGDVFVAKLSLSTGGPDSLIYSTFLGGENSEAGLDSAVDSDGNVYITGYTWSPDFPTTPDAYDNSFNGDNYDSFVAKLSPSTGGPDSLVYSTFLGGEGKDSCSGIAVDSDGNAYIAGYTASENFPTVNPYDGSYNGGLCDVFVAKIAFINMPPTVEITKPKKALYIMNFKLRNYLIRNPLIIGKIDIEVDVPDNISGVDRVEFYINGKLQATITEEPYHWTWKRGSFFKHRHTIKVVAYDTVGNQAINEITVRRFF